MKRLPPGPNILGGVISTKDKMAPSYIDLSNPKYIEINGIYYCGLIVINYGREFSEIILKNLIEIDSNINISIFYEKQDTYKTIRELTYHIGNTGVEIQGKNQNREDIDIAAFTYNDAKYIRKQMQVYNEELYYLYMYFSIFEKSKEKLEYLINKIEAISQSSGIQTKRATFRQEQTFISCLPLLINNEEIKKVSKRNVLTSGLSGIYPFTSSHIHDENGIYIGNNLYNNSPIFIDRYETKKYKNANMSIFGTSGAGKSFYIKLLIIRNRLQGIDQYIIDPEREYEEVAKNLDGLTIKFGPSSNTFINILDIRENSIEEGKGYLAAKIQKLHGFFQLIFGEMKEEEKAILEEKIIECYKQKSITFDDNTLYKKQSNKINIKPIFKESEDMPILEDLYKILQKDKKTESMSIKLKPYIYGSQKHFNKKTNVELNQKIIVADVYDLGEKDLKLGMYLFTELFFDKIKENRNKKKSIYLDEVWRLIGVTSNKDVASFVYNIFKTIRKYGGSAVAITQDISDLFSLENGVYGKSILNNSSIKSFFSLEEENILLLSKYTSLSEKEKIEIKSLKRGECLMFAGDDHIITKIEAADFEKKLIGE